MRKGVLKQRFVFLVPFLTCRHIGQRQEVGGFTKSGLPPNGMTIARRTVEDVAVTHLGNEHIFHCHLQIWVGVEDGIKHGRVARHVVILQRDGRKLVHRTLGGLHVVGEFARNDVPFEVAAPADNTGCHLDKR